MAVCCVERSCVDKFSCSLCLKCTIETLLFSRYKSLFHLLSSTLLLSQNVTSGDPLTSIENKLDFRLRVGGGIEELDLKMDDAGKLSSGEWSNWTWISCESQSAAGRNSLLGFLD